MEKPVIILGAHGLGKVALEILQQNGIVVYGFLDDDQALQGKEINHVPVLGNTTEERYLDLIGEKCTPFVAVEQQGKSQQIMAMLKEQNQAVTVNAIHSSAVIAASATLGHGNLVNAHASIDVNATLGSHCILHTQVAVEHGAVIKDSVQIGAGSVIGANATLNECVFVGAGATIIAGVEIGANASIGAGSVVLANVKPGKAVLGNPAKPVKLK